jgi:hypothetical protein
MGWASFWHTYGVYGGRDDFKVTEYCSLLYSFSLPLLPTGRCSPPCPASSFPLQWEYPFPVITGENQ